MNLHHHSLSAPAAVLTFALLSETLCAQVTGTQMPVTPQRPQNPRDIDGTVRVATPEAPGRSIGEFAGRSVRTRKGEDLGTIKDVVIDVHAGRIVYALVASRTNEALRLVPFAALDQLENANGTTVEIELANWEQLAPVRAQEFETGRLTLSEADRQLLAERFGKTEPRPPGAPPSSGSQRGAGARTSGGSQLLPLGQLRGKKVSTGNENVGTINDVMVDTNLMTAAAVIAAEPDFVAGGQRFIVSLRQLNIAARDLDPITIALTRADFEKAQLAR